ncbi:HYR domain-containing protein, partial [Mariniflexile soesokkakense]
MKQLYANKTFTNSSSIKLMLFAFLLLSTIYNSYGQVRVPFTPRTSSYTPTKTNYKIKGDFTMIGNTNLQLAGFTYPTNASNINDMQYVDIDGDSNTWNSSSANLTFSTENGAIPDCSKIIYAGLYWTGRAFGDSETDSETFQVTKTVPTGGTTTQQVTNTGLDIRNGNSIANTNYSLSIAGNNPTIFTFSSSGAGDNVRFRYNNNTPVIEVSRNNGSWTTISSNSSNNGQQFNSPYLIFSDSNYTLQVTFLRSQNPARALVNVTYNQTVAQTTQVTKTFNKRKVSIKGPTAAAYTEVTATGIAFPTNGDDRNMYSAYAEVTDYVRQYGIGNYFVADIALREGNVDGTGYYGGWGMVVIYENSKMKWRDVTVFDGHAHVTNGVADHTINVSGFNAVQNGDVNLKLGLMAGEGDIQWTGDYFQIEQRNTGLYQPLSHSNNSATNFFNSSILTGGNARNPNYQNNTGLDIAMFNVNNTGNAIINNNQTSTSFRYGSAQDTYIIFNITFSVDAYVPQVDGILTTTSINGNPNPPTQSLEPGQAAGYKIEIRNKGTEATNNTIITVPIPNSINPSNLNIISNVYAPLTTTNTPVYNPSLGPNGSIVWDLGTLPVPSNPDTVLADISFSLTVTTDCSKLLDPSFDPNVALYGTVKGTGAISNINFENDLVLGYQTSGLCVGEPIPVPSLIAINYLNYTNQPPTASNPLSISVQCKADVPNPNILVVTDEADNSGIPPIVAFVSDISDNGINPEIITRNYSVTDDCNNSINVEQTITILDNTLPTITCPANVSVSADAGLCTASGVALGSPITSDNCSVASVTNDAVQPFALGDTTVTWTVTDGSGNTATCTQIVTVIDNELPTITCPTNVNANTDSGLSTASGVVLGSPSVADNCSVASVTNDAPTSFPIGDTTFTWTVTDGSGNIATCTQTVTITDNENPSIACPGDIAQNVDTGVDGA